jgi:hypothetical protein
MSTSSTGTCRQEEETGKESEAMECVDSSEERVESKAGVTRADTGAMLVKGEAEADKNVVSEGAVGMTKDEDIDVTPHSEETEGDLLPLLRSYIYSIYIRIRKTELTENGNFRLFAANGKRKRQTSVCFLQTEIGSLFSLVGKP